MGKTGGWEVFIRKGGLSGTQVWSRTSAARAPVVRMENLSLKEGLLATIAFANKRCYDLSAQQFYHGRDDEEGKADGTDQQKKGPDGPELEQEDSEHGDPMDRDGEHGDKENSVDFDGEHGDKEKSVDGDSFHSDEDAEEDDGDLDGTQQDPMPPPRKRCRGKSTPVAGHQEKEGADGDEEDLN